MESRVHSSRAESTFTSEANGDLAVDSSVFKPWRPGPEGIMKMENEVHKEREWWDERMKCAYRPFPTQRMEEIWEINRKNIYNEIKNKKSGKRKLLGKEYES